MGIRYFATNRGRHELGRAAKNRDARIRLQKGGYNFVDMHMYMGHYLAEVDTETLPVQAVVAQSQKTVFEDFIGHPSIGRVVIVIHGFNVEFYEAYTWSRIFLETARHVEGDAGAFVSDPDDPADIARMAAAGEGSLTAFIGFSWPSNGNVVSYPSDQKEAIGTAPVLADLVGRIITSGCQVRLMCHSMGNFLACHMLAGLVAGTFHPPSLAGDTTLIDRGSKKDGTEQVERNAWLVDRMVMVAPDVERRHVTKSIGYGQGEVEYIGQFYSGLQHLVRDVVNVYSRFDGAMSISDIEKIPRKAAGAAGDFLSRATFGVLDFLERNPHEKWEKRLGSVPHPVGSPPNMRSLNATEIAGMKIDHSDHIDSEKLVIALIRELLAK